MANRFNTNLPKNKDNSSSKLQNDFQTPTYAATIAVTTKDQAYKTLVKVSLTGALTLSAGVTNPKVGDVLEFLFSADAGGARVVTFGTGFSSAGTLSVAASKFGSAGFMFDGNSWVETKRAATA